MIDNKKLSVHVNMGGDEYLALLKYKDSKKPDYKKWNWGAIMGFSFAFLGLVALSLMVQEWFFPQPPPFEFTIRGVLMFMGIAAGIGWIFHGTGFLLVRR